MASDPFILPVAPKTWTNHHLNISVPLGARWRVTNEPSPTTTEGLKRAATRIQRLLSNGVAAGVRVRSCGSRWSFSDIPVAKNGWMIETDQLNWHRPVKFADLDLAYRGTAEELYLAQCGASIAEINAAIETPAMGRAFRTTGASNGQTIGGALGTGIHGSAIDVAGFESQVAGFQLITSTRNIWIEREDAPTLSADYVRKLGATLVRNSHWFEAGLVSLGALGVMSAILLKTTGRYRLKSSLVHLAHVQAKAAMNSLNFNGLALPRPGERPYFFQAILEPSTMATAFVHVRYKVSCPPDYVPNYDIETGYEPGTDLPRMISAMIDQFPALRDLTVRTLMGIELAPKDQPLPKTPGETYTFTKSRRGIASSGFAVPVAQTSAALSVAQQAFRENAAAPVLFTCRYVQKSPGLLSFTRFDPTCVFDIDGIDSAATQRLIALTADRLEAAGIPFTQHWGKTNSLTAARLRRAFGSGIDRWNQIRHEILPSEEERDAFSTTFIDGLGLNG
jgi:hypothetical protein